MVVDVLGDDAGSAERLGNVLAVRDARGEYDGLLAARQLEPMRHDIADELRMVDTIHVRGLPDDVGLLVIDECHGVAGSQKYRTLLARYNLVPVVGLTATPFAVGMAKDYPDIGGPLFEHLVVGATIGELIEGGFLVDVDIYAPSEPDLAGVRSSKGIDGVLDYNQADLDKAVDAGDQHAGVEATGILGLQDAVLDAVAVQDGGRLFDELLTVGDKDDTPALGGRLLDDRSRRERLAAAGRQVEHHAPLTPSQCDARLMLGVELIGTQLEAGRRDVRNHRRPLSPHPPVDSSDG